MKSCQAQESLKSGNAGYLSLKQVPDPGIIILCT